MRAMRLLLVYSTLALVVATEQESPLPRVVCTNSCSKARNGVCEEGRVARAVAEAGVSQEAANREVLVYCDLGTDCEDCGPWETTSPSFSTPWEAEPAMGPIRLLQSKDVQVRVRAAGVPADAAFRFAYTDPEADVDVSKSAHSKGVVERGISEILYGLLRDRCFSSNASSSSSTRGAAGASGHVAAAGGSHGGQQPQNLEPQQPLFVDVGANFGWFTLMAARLGCRVVAYEPVPLFRAFLTFALHLNGLGGGRVLVRPVAASDVGGGRRLRLVVPSRGIWGTAGVEGLNIDGAIEGSKSETIEVDAVRLDEEDALMAAGARVAALKVDVEGWEPAVIRGAEGLLKRGSVEDIIMEYSPGVPERHFQWQDIAAHPAMLDHLIAQLGYRIGLIGDSGKGASMGGWGEPPRPLREVTQGVLKYDIEDIKRWENNTLGCPPPPELQEFPQWGMCSVVPENLNPRSLRSEFSHNTNLWAAKSTSDGEPAGVMAGGGSRGLLRLEGTAGFFGPDVPHTAYFPPDAVPGKGLGLGQRPCMWLAPKTHVRHRCRCTKPELCGEEEARAMRAAATGALSQNYILPDDAALSTFTLERNAAV
ncbi:hypothetical protein HYH02_002857 [Chlamydomonas schloesseri]|uniref:Methyltransferase FkbM domain-containing protein n=1 Tax=Chlamydomonas schloesseri TaxID=2026947 RepID=A0A835WS17_9CHLO|nr:hypothetical protein HYH02_002857 [Chlamydomonas schloesseri]|eukprot:KAG2452620.1 hypothetical protein HYH02_002857 [Chlamydomonas schloesseri]